MQATRNHADLMPQQSDIGIDLLSKETLHDEMARVFQPIVRGFMLPVVLFYALVIVPNFVLSPLDKALRLSVLSAITAIAAWFFRSLLRRSPADFNRLERIGGAVLLLIYVNCFNLLLIDFQALNLIYFLLLFLLTASVAISPRLIVAFSVLTLATILGSAYLMGPVAMFYYSFVSFAAALAAIGMAILMRGAIMSSVRARVIAERLRSRAEFQADYDALTGLPNRRRFFAHIDAVISGGDDAKAMHVGIIDLDGFKPVNDLYGHAIGDELLIKVGERIRTNTPADFLVARLGGDEFALSVDGTVPEAELIGIGAAICNALREPFVISGIGIAISASIGFAHFPTNGRTLRQIYERADHALYRAKRESRGDVVVFSPAHECEMSDIGRVEQALRTADLQRELHVMFQPQHDLVTGRTTGFEALARWQSPSLGAVSPQLFIAAAERSGLIERLTGILLRKSLVAAKTWPEDVSVSFNLSGLDLISERSIANVMHLVEESGVTRSRITFEITETAMMHDFERARASLQALAGEGCRIALDDFGAGYSSFAYIHRLPLNRIKMDRSFVTRLAEDEAVSRNIIRAIADLSANLGVECLAEGVETEAELSVIRAAGIRYVQGYYFGRPLAAADVPSCLASTAAGTSARPVSA